MLSDTTQDAAQTPSPRTVLVTGATGKLGSVVCRELVARGHRVRATDVKFAKEQAGELVLGDLREELFVYRALEGCDALVHLGNHPNRFAGPSRQRLLAENVAMNSNVLFAALDLGVRDVVFASSIQVFLRSTGPAPPPYALPYLPLDGHAPTNPSLNTYALSKEFCERTLHLLCEEEPTLAATSLRFPMLLGDDQLERLRARPKLSSYWVNFAEAMSLLAVSDAARLVALSLERRTPGYHQYFPATTWQVDKPIEALIHMHYPDVELRKPIDAIDGLIDLSALERDLGWTPLERFSAEIEG